MLISKKVSRKGEVREVACRLMILLGGDVSTKWVLHCQRSQWWRCKFE